MKLSGHLSTAEIEAVLKQWICRVQKRDRLTPHYEQTQRELNLQEGLVCRGRIQGMYPIYIAALWSAVYQEIYVNDIGVNIESRIRLFADDTLLYATANGKTLIA